MRLTGLENTPVDYTVHINDDFIQAYGLLKASSNSSREGLVEAIEPMHPIKCPGGSAANVCHGFANLSLEAAFIGSVGNDENGRYYADELRKAGVIPYLAEKRGKTGVCATLITPDHERTFAVSMGKSSSLEPWDFEAWQVAVSDMFHTTAYALDSMYLTVLRAMNIAKKHHAKISFDLASVKHICRHRKKIRHLLENYVDIVFANEEEAKAYTGENELRKAMLNEKLRYCGRHSHKEHLVVVKCGSQGAGIYSDAIWGREHGVFAKIPSYKVSEVKNTNGAGDAFAAGFLYGITKWHEFIKAAQIGAYYAARVVEVESARLPYRISNIEELI